MVHFAETIYMRRKIEPECKMMCWQKIRNEKPCILEIVVIFLYFWGDLANKETWNLAYIYINIYI